MRRHTPGILLAASLAGLPAPSAGEEAGVQPRLEIRLVTPIADDVLEGTSPIEAAVDRLGDIQILKVDFYVDGERVGWRDEPPDRIEWNAGDGLKARWIRAVAYGSNGRTYEEAVRTTEIHVDYRERVSVVNVFATVRDFGGEYAGNIKQEEFRIFEDGVQQAVSHFAYENLPLHVVFLLDASLTMKGERIKTAREAAERFARSLDYARDRAAVVTFAGTPRLAALLTSDEDTVLAAIRATKETAGGTALYDGIVLAMESLEPVQGRKAVVLLSDGRDESGDGFRPGSLHSYEEALAIALRGEAIFYTIGVGKGIRDQKDFFGIRTVESILESFAGQTGGTVYFATRVGQLRRAYENVAKALRHQYNLGYSSTNHDRDGSWREIRVVVDREGYEVSARKGYYAPGD